MTKYSAMVNMSNFEKSLIYNAVAFRVWKPKFEEFLSLLGEKIRLKGWDKYRGGLDIKGKEFIHISDSYQATLIRITHKYY